MMSLPIGWHHWGTVKAFDKWKDKQEGEWCWGKRKQETDQQTKKHFPKYVILDTEAAAYWYIYKYM